MKKLTTISVAALIACATISCNKTNNKNAELTNLQDSASYVVGVNIGSQLSQISIDIEAFTAGLRDVQKKDSAYIIGFNLGAQLAQESLNMDVLIAAMNDAQNEESQKISQEDMQAVMQKYDEAQLHVKFPQIEEGERFLAENAKREGVQTTESGLQYEVITMGAGEKPGQFDEVTVHYHGTKLDGTVFDSSKGAEPRVFNVSQMVPGFSEGLQLFPAGSKFKLFIPQDLAYGSRVQPGDPIKPFETLIFEVELISFKKGEAPQQQQATDYNMEELMQQMQMQQQ